MNKLNGIVLIISFLLIGLSIVKDIKLSDQRVGDLRNRIVGSRLQKDGFSPYFYKWKKGDSIRYYDPLNDNNLHVSSCTSTPFFHVLLYPIAELTYRTASWLWVFVLYGVLMIMMTLTFMLSNKRLIPILCIICICFTLTEAWLDTMVAKQMYLFVPFLAMLIYFFVRKGTKNEILCFVAGVFSVFLLLIKPNTIFFFLPFIFIHKRYNLSAVIFFFLPIVIGLVLTLSTSQLNLWRNYMNNVKEHTKVHQALDPVLQENDRGSFSELEGFRLEGYQNSVTRWYHPYVEHGNFFVMINLLFKYKISTTLLLLLSCAAIIIILIVFYLNSRKAADAFSLESVCILGYCLYMISDLTTPIHRGQYNTVQWLFPLLLLPITFQAKYKWLYLLILSVFILQIHYKPFLLMQHTVGEYLWIMFFLLYAFVYRNDGKPNQILLKK